MQNQLFLGPPKSGKTCILTRLASECDANARPFVWIVPCGMARMRPFWNPVTQHTFSSLFGVEEDIWFQWVHGMSDAEQVLKLLRKKNASYRWQALQEYIQTIRVVFIDNAERVSATEWSLFAQLMSEITEKRLPTFFVAANLLYTPGIQPGKLHISYFFESPHWHSLFQHRPIDLRSESLCPTLRMCYEQNNAIDNKVRETFKKKLRPLKQTKETQGHIFVVTCQDTAARLSLIAQKHQQTRLFHTQETDWIKWNDEYFAEYEKKRSEYTVGLIEGKNPDQKLQYQYHQKYAHMRWSSQYAATYLNQFLPVEKVLVLWTGARVMSLGSTDHDHGRLGTVLSATADSKEEKESVLVCWDQKEKPERVARATWTICCDEGFKQIKQFPLRLAIAMTVAELHALGKYDLPLFISTSHAESYAGALYTILAHASLEALLIDQKKPLCWADLHPQQVVRQLLHQLTMTEQKTQLNK